MENINETNNLESDNDPVEYEFPVLLSTSLADKLYVFQYPIRPASKGYDKATFLKTSIKPENQEFRIEVGLDCNSINYDQRKGEKIALDADGPFDRFENDKDRFFQSDLMDKTILQSSRAVPDCSNYSIGSFQGNELHITPLKSIVQLRPQFNYLEPNEKNKDDELKKHGNDSDEEETKTISVTFLRNRTEASKKLQEQSFENHSKKSSEELWIDTRYINAGSTQAQLTRLEMFNSSNEVFENSLGLSCKEYLHLLAQSTNSDEHSNSNGSTVNERSSHYISTRPLLDQIRIILRDAKVISFKQLRSMIDLKHETTDMVKYLQQVAVLVQGNWVVQSELVYPRDKTSSQNGISAELMCRARDYILLTFTENEYVTRKAISSVIKLPAEEIEEILTNLGIAVPKKGWRLLIPPNTEFANKFSDIAHRQALYWDAKRKHLKEVIGVQSHPPQRQRRRSNRESIGSENEERNVGRGKKTIRDSSLSEDAVSEPVKTKKNVKSRKVSEPT